jgi:hypothetical protein
VMSGGMHATPRQQFSYFQCRDFPFSIHSMVVLSLLRRVSSVLAAVIHYTYSFLWL